MLALGLLQLTANVSKPKKKYAENWKRPEKKKKNPFIFLSMPFILFAILKKKNQILNFKIRKSKIQKKKKKRRRENWH
jgi:hypothetical protein